MKILIVIPTMHPASGGPPQGIRNFVPELNKLGIICEVLSYDNPEAEYLGKDNFKIHALGESKSKWRYNKQLVSWLSENIQNYDCLTLHALWLYQSYAVHKVIKLLRGRNLLTNFKYFVMPHGILNPYFQEAKERKLKAIRNFIYWKLIENRIVNDANGILFTCEEEMRLARTTPFSNYHPKKEYNVRYGITPPPAYKDSFKIAFNTLINKEEKYSEKPYLLFLGRIRPIKGVDLLIEAYEAIIESNLYDSIPDLVIAGPGIDTKFGANILHKVKTNSKLSNKVHFVGMVSGDTKWGAFYGCEAFILPSHQENFGIAVVEALACSKPVLISDKINIWKEIKDAGAGLVKNDSKEGTLKLLTEWIGLTNVRKKEMSEAAFNCYKSYFTNTRTASALFKIFTEN